MNLENFRAIAEILGIIAVLVTLVDIARQTREGNWQKKVDTMQHLIESLNNLSMVLAQSPELAAIVTRGRDSFASLRRDEQLQFEHFHGPLLNILENWLFQINTFHLKADRDSAYEDIRKILRTYFNYPGALEFWEKYKNMFPGQLHELMKEAAK